MQNKLFKLFVPSTYRRKFITLRRWVRVTSLAADTFLENQAGEVAVMREGNWEEWTGKKLPIDGSLEFFHVEPGAIRQSDFLNVNFPVWMQLLREPIEFHNKKWQYFTLMQNLWNHFGGDFKGKRGLVFGVGTEPTVALLASLGCEITATDYFESSESELWSETNQMAASLEVLNRNGVCDPEKFSQSVSLSNLDMKNIPAEFSEEFDFVWSLCALGHIGGYQQGLDFILESSKLLKPGGIAIHTTEMDVSDELSVFSRPDLSLYRRHDLVRVLNTLSDRNFVVREHDFSDQPGYLDQLWDVAPYKQNPHLRLIVEGHKVVPVSLVFNRTK